VSWLAASRCDINIVKSPIFDEANSPVCYDTARECLDYTTLAARTQNIVLAQM